MAKRHLVKQLGSSSLNYEDLTTILAQIEGCMNSRPLTALNDDPHDLRPLTPAQLAINRSLQSLPDPDLRSVPVNRMDRYQRIQEKVQSFWYRWRTEYLNELNQQMKNSPIKVDIPIGSIVVLKDELLPPVQWPLARVMRLHPGKDDTTRVVTLRTASGVLQRPTSKICILPWDLEKTSESSGAE